MKANKIITTITLILGIIIISLASFFGVYSLREYKMVDITPKYLLGMDFTNSRIIRLKISDEIKATTIYDSEGNIVEEQDGIDYSEEKGYKKVETKVNSEEVLTQENFKKVKLILEKRLKKLKAGEYTIKQNSTTGELIVQIPENDSTDYILNYLIQTGKLNIIDDETKAILMDNRYVVKSNVVYNSEEEGTAVYLQIEFNKEGAKILEDISKVYIQTTQTDEEGKETSVTKKISVYFDNTKYLTTYFGATMTDGVLNIPIGQSKATEELQEYVITATGLSTLLNNKVLPVEYTATQEISSSNIEQKQINIFLYVLAIIIILTFLYLIIKYRLKGIIACSLQIGYISLLLLIVRYTNILITFEGIVGILFSIAFNYIFIIDLLNNIKKNPKDNYFNSVLINSIFRLIPVLIISIIFTFSGYLKLASLGMTLLWGIITLYLINLVFTKLLYKNVTEN